MNTGTPAIRPTAPALGLVEWLRPGDENRVERLLSDMQRLGLRHLRTGVSWADWHTEDGRRWISWLLPRLARADIEVLPCVTYTPPSLGIRPKTSAPPRDPKAYADFLDVLVTEFGDGFEWVELWNEPNNLNDWDWRIDPDWTVFREMIVGAAHWMHQRGKKTVLGGMCPTDPNWLRLLAENGALADIDAISLHGFPGTWTHDGRSWADHIAEIRDAVPEVGERIQVWITEAGYSTWRHDERGQLDVLLDLLEAPVGRAYWYAWADLHHELASQEGFHVDERHYHFGLVRDDGTPKLLYRLLEKGGPTEVRRVAALAKGAPMVAKAVRPTLVTGGAGFLGSNIVDRLAREGRHVLVYDNLSRPGVERNLAWLRDTHGAKVEAVCGDIRDRWTVREVVAEADSVFHLAAQVAVTTSVADPRGDFDVNLLGCMNVLEGARRRKDGPPRMVFASTNKVYGALGALKTRETPTTWEPVDASVRRHGVSELQPLDLYSPYGCSKGAADQYVLDHARIYGVPATVFRMSCLYGPRQFGTEDQGWLAHFLISALNEQPITLYGDGKQVRDALFVDDVVDAYLLAEKNIDALAGCAFNIGGGPQNAVSLVQALDLIGDLSGRTPDVSFGDWRPGDQVYYVSDTRTFQALTGWKPTVGVAEGMARLRDWLVDHEVAAPPAELPETPKKRMAV